MSWSFSIGRIAGTEIRVHITFFLLLAWIALSYYRIGGTDAAVHGVIFILALFACVVAHEFGHILTARRFGIRTPDVTLLPIGGVARLERMPEKPGEEILVALAGPAVNVVIAAVLFLFVGGRFDPSVLEAVETPAADFLTKLAMVNLFLAVFNMLPAFPMDGGRVLRALLAYKYSRVQATNIAAVIGQGLAFGLGFLGLLGNPVLIFIAIFIYLAASAEAQGESLSALSQRHSAQDTMITKFQALNPSSTIGDAADALVDTTQHEFPVIDDSGNLLGFLTKARMIQSLAKEGGDVNVMDVMERDVPLVDAGARLGDAIIPLRERRAPAVGVTGKDGKLAGYITLENIAEMLMVDTALESARLAAKRTPNAA
ncbi:MAG: site-2 protease family protein [Hyphomicrobiales bacterium]